MVNLSPIKVPQVGRSHFRLLYRDNRKAILFCLHTSSDAPVNLVQPHPNSNPLLNF